MAPSVCVSVCLSECLAAKKTSQWLHISKNVGILQVFTFLKRIKMAILFLDFFGSDLSKMDQTCSNWTSQQSKNVSVQSCHIYKLDKNCHYILDQIGSDLSKMD